MHYFQTSHAKSVSSNTFETLTELHYSKTNAHLHRSKKSLKYLQNHTTLKQRLCFIFLCSVWGIYRITLTLKPTTTLASMLQSLRYLQNYTTLKLLIPYVDIMWCLRHLQNYTTLKRNFIPFPLILCLRHLQNYTTLKLWNKHCSELFSLRHLQNYTTLKPQTQIQVQRSKACPVTTKCNPVNTVKSNRSHYLKYIR